MSEPLLPPASAPTPPVDERTTLADGAWHRMHPLTPLFKGGLVLIIIAGIVISNMRERLGFWFFSLVAPDADIDGLTGGDPIDWVLENNFVLVGLGVVLGVLVLFIGIFWLVWRFQEFRITGEHVEVRKGILFRSQRRAPLDRVQGVNLTRPFPARIIGLAKLEVVGAGTDANVPLEYLATARAESVRADILRLASGARAARQDRIAGVAPGAPTTARAQLVNSVNHGVTDLITGVDLADVQAESVVKIPTGRLVGSHLLSGVLWFLFFALIYVAALGGVAWSVFRDGDPEGGIIILTMSVGLAVPFIIATIGVTWAQISKSLRYSIASTPDGVRITYGLLTTVTETIPPGRIFAVDITQSLLWRPFGWWVVRINRMSGKSLAQQQSSSAQQFNVVLPVGTRADVERVLALILPDAPESVRSLIWENGALGPSENDPYETMPRRAAWRRPLSWRRHGYAVTPFALFQRRGVVWRKLVIFPLARLQGFSLSQGPIDRLQRVTGVQAHSVTGPVQGVLAGIERDSALGLLDEVARFTALAAAQDRGHRWAEALEEALDQASASDVAAAVPPVAPTAATAVPPLAPTAPTAAGTVTVEWPESPRRDGPSA
ncbi:PH domain-containing protein [Microbacterium keratanolyticum]|uniref:PH domain-containing protein n=1 Tax=Microbacterium keratanolyticum TaxID=67574 RepID=UPI003624D427